MMSESRHTALSGFAVRAGVHFSFATGFDFGRQVLCFRLQRCEASRPEVSCAV